MPEQVYWRRRAVAIGVAVVVLIVVIVLFASQCGGTDPVVDDTARSTTPAAPSSTTAKSTTKAPAATTADSSEAEKAEQDEAAAIEQGQCPDSAIGITVSSEKPNYEVGQQPRFFTTITNIGNVPCARDLGDAVTPNTVTTLDGQTRVWSSTDCFPGGESRIVTLEPGKQERTQIDWSGTTSDEGCVSPREPVGPGAYAVTAYNGGKASAPETFNIG